LNTASYFKQNNMLLRYDEPFLALPAFSRYQIIPFSTNAMAKTPMIRCNFTI